MGIHTENGNSCRNILIKATKKFMFKCSYEKCAPNPPKYLGYIRQFSNQIMAASVEYKIADFATWNKIHNMLINYKLS